ncbi:hypothetical protein F4820DRAFT_151321 [Hypoxylon rubiginosum]|uniref:Uncharacterized protein n=1 Tax=Hypoxylon rubiginosum TaxID=110542 RepID=A0ACB9Z8W8_9PEZI|nr:hypothetical protein F4820DRAFT_151321 [Hypoxylon rubiginosum]
MDDCFDSRCPRGCEDIDTGCGPLSLLDTGGLRGAKLGNDDDGDGDGDGDTCTLGTEVSKVPVNSVMDQASSKQDSFPQFRLLPIELRTLIWKHFCPDLSRKSGRVIYLELVRIAPITYTVLESKGVGEQTRALRAVMSTHHESRKLALEFFPETHKIRDGKGEIRYNSDRDKMILRFRLKKPLLVDKSLENDTTTKVNDLKNLED